MSRRGRNIVERLPETKRTLRVRSCVIGELVGPGDVFALRRAINDRCDDVICIAAFDLLALNGVDLRTLPLSARQEGLKKIVDNGPGCLQLVEHFPNGRELLEAAEKLKA
jgi:ATP-dependent DNA ligase